MLKSVWREEKNFEVLKRGYIKIYLTSVFAMLWKSCLSSTYVKLRVDKCAAFVKEAVVSDIKREVTKFDTVILHSNWSSLRRKDRSTIPIDHNALKEHLKFRTPPTDDFPALYPQKSSQHVRACTAHDGAICSKN